MNVIPFPRDRSRRAFASPVEPPAALGGQVADATSAHEAQADALEDRRRMQQNLAACVLVVVLLVAGAWIVERLKTYARTLACLESQHRQCTVLDPRHLPAR